MRAVAAYMASRNREGENDRRNGYSIDRQQQPNQYTARNAVGEYWPGENEMRGGRDGGSQQMNDYGAESRYRGRDGRWRAGRRRSEYEEGAYGNYPVDRRMGGDDEEEEEKKKYSVTVQPKNVIQWPYMPGTTHEPTENRMIGFGTRDREYQTRSHYGEGMADESQHYAMRDGAENWNENAQHGGMMALDRETGEKWVRHMRDDKDQPIKPWNREELKPLARRYGIDPNGEKFDDFFIAVHMMKSDYGAVAKEFDVDTPAYYAALADAWLKDPDAGLTGRDKLAAYYFCIVKAKK